MVELGVVRVLACPHKFENIVFTKSVMLTCSLHRLLLWDVNFAGGGFFHASKLKF